MYLSQLKSNVLLVIGRSLALIYKKYSALNEDVKILIKAVSGIAGVLLVMVLFYAGLGFALENKWFSLLMKRLIFIACSFATGFTFMKGVKLKNAGPIIFSFVLMILAFGFGMMSFADLWARIMGSLLITAGAASFLIIDNKRKP